jgi:hypothetical protein
MASYTSEKTLIMLPSMVDNNHMTFFKSTQTFAQLQGIRPEGATIRTARPNILEGSPHLPLGGRQLRVRQLLRSR